MAVVTTQQSVAALYTAIFNRAPDQAGLNFWTAQINGGASFATIAEGFAQHEVFTTGIGALPNADYVNALYTNILGSAGDAAGIAYWTARLAAGESKASVVASFVEGSLTIDLPALLAAGSLTQADYDLALVRQQTLTNKADVGIYFANTLGAASNLNPATVSTSKAGLEADPIYKASQAAIAGVDSTAASVKTAQDAIAVAAGSPNPGQALLGQTFTLTAGADTLVGGAASDVFNALTIDATGAAATTLSPFDSIDGGAGKDTLNIYSDGTNNTAVKAGSFAVKNVETININNSGAGTGFGAVDASKFVGATAINQVNIANAVTGLAAGTVAGFQNIGGSVSVQAADAAATAAVSLTNLAEGKTVTVGATGTGVLNSVTVTGTVADTNNDGTVANTTVAVTAGKDVQSVAVNTAVATTLTVTDGAGTKKVSTVDASASTGSINYITAAVTVANIKTGAGNDTATLIFAGTDTANAATLSTGAGNDDLTVNVTQGTATAVTATVDAGEGNDTIKLAIKTGVTYNVAAGAGDDTVVITGTVKTTDKIDGGAGTDTVSLDLGAPKTLVADDYIVFNKVLTNFETLQLTGSAATMDASQLGAGYTTIDLATGSVVTEVGAQALIAHGSLTATAAGTDVGATPKVYAGTLNITDKAAGNIIANADKVALTVAPTTNNDGAVNNTAVTLTGDFKSAAVTLSATTDTKGTAADTTDDVLDTSSVSVTTVKAGALENLASLTLSGNGAATVIVGDTKLVSVDASGLNSVDIAGKAAAGLTYTSDNTAAETIKLGGGLDHVTLGASTYGAIDKVQGLNLVLNTAGTALDGTSDTISLGGAGAVFTKFTTTQTDLDLALKDAAAGTSSNVVFQMGGNTYIFQDNAAGAANHLLDAGDTVVQLTGQVNLDALVHALAVA